MTDLIEKVAREICFNGEYEDFGDGMESATCAGCDSHRDCTDWNVRSLGYTLQAKAAIQTVLREMMIAPSKEVKAVSMERHGYFDGGTWKYSILAFANSHGIEIGGEDG